jgi:uncharacterized DUF497 family protein
VIQFEWNTAKARANEAKHGVAFERAKQAFADPFAIALFDDRDDYGEERYNLIGMTARRLLFLAYTERGDRVRITSARRVTKHEQEAYEQERGDP